MWRHDVYEERSSGTSASLRHLGALVSIQQPELIGSVGINFNAPLVFATPLRVLLQRLCVFVDRGPMCPHVLAHTVPAV